MTSVRIVICFSIVYDDGVGGGRVYLERRMTVEQVLGQILEALKGLREGQGRLEEHMGNLEVRMDGLDKRMDGLDVCMDGLEKGQANMERKLDAVHEQVVENCEKLTKNEMTFKMFQDLWLDHEKEIHKLKSRTG